MLLKLVAVVSIIAASVILDHWKSDPETAKVTFKVKGPFGTVDGKFSGLKTEIQFDEKDPSRSSISASIDAKTVSTGIGLEIFYFAGRNDVTRV